MLVASDVERIANLCTSISNEVADEAGFVAIPNLLARFGAQIVVRPLLVEGMIATVDVPNNDGRKKWVVLIDSHSYDVSPREIAEETSRRPLPSRLRNTVAHE